MSDDHVRAARMRSQRLDGRARTVVDAVRHLVGVQAQEPRAAALSIRARTEGVVSADVERAIGEERSIVRTWTMRGTLHLVTAEDSGWLHDLFAPHLARRQHQALDALGVPPADRRKAVDTIVRALAHGPLTRAELTAALERAGLDASGRRGAHLPRLAALEGHVCSGPPRGREDRYVLVDDWLGPRPRLARDAALRELARRYAAAFAPADAADLAKWSGLPLRDVRAAWSAVAVTGGGAAPPDPPVVRLLPAFDTYLLGYLSRDAAVPAEHAREVWPGGGIIRPTVVANGLVVGTWRLRRGRADVEPFAEPVDAEEEIADVRRFVTAPAGTP